MKRDKSGLEMAITTVIMIILSISVLTVLIVFFNSQTHFLSRWFGAQSSQGNVDAFISSCNSLVVSESFYAYCCEEKLVEFGEGKQSQKTTCGEATYEDWSSKRIDFVDCEWISC